MSKKKKLIFFSHLAVSTYMTGAELFLLKCLQQLSSSFNCVLISPGESMLEKECRKLGIETQLFSYPMLWGMWKPSKSLKKKQKKLAKHPSVQAISQLLDKLKADAVITNSCINPIPAIAAFTNRLPVSWIIHETISKNAYTNDAINFINGYSDHLIGVSNTVLQPFRQRDREPFLIYPLSKHVSPSINEQEERHLFRAIHGIPEHPVVVGLAAAYVTKDKGLEDFLYVAKNQSQKNVLFMIVGALPKDVAIRSFIKQSRVLHLPFLNDMAYWYCAIDILVVPSLIDEGFPLTALEASFYGKPVVAYRSGGLVEQMESLNHEEFLVERGNRTALLEKVNQLIESPRLRTEIGTKLKQKNRVLYGEEAFRLRVKNWSKHL